MTHLGSLSLLPLMHYQVMTCTQCPAFQLLLLNPKAAELKVGVGLMAAEMWNEQGVSRNREMSLKGTLGCRWQAQGPGHTLAAMFIIGSRCLEGGGVELKYLLQLGPAEGLGEYVVNKFL